MRLYKSSSAAQKYFENIRIQLGWRSASREAYDNLTFDHYMASDLRADLVRQDYPVLMSRLAISRLSD